MRIDDIRVFVCAADLGSFSGAARELDLTPSVASVAVKRLETDLGKRLFVRSTRSLRLTDDGERYLEHAREALRHIDSGRMAIDHRSDRMAGLLRISVPSDLGRNQLRHWLDDFLARYPAVQVNLRISDRLADLYRQSVDVAIRYGHLDDSALVAVPLAPHNQRILCASPAYLQRYGHPQRLEDLQRHNCLRFVLGDTVHDCWQFTTPKGTTRVRVSGDRTSDDGDLVRRWAVDGAGIAYKSGLDLADDLRAGRLERLLPEAGGEPTPLNLLCTDRHALSPLIRQLAATLRENCARLIG